MYLGSFASDSLIQIWGSTPVPEASKGRRVEHGSRFEYPALVHGAK